MSTILADDHVAALLKQATQLSEVRDASGRVIGFFAPVSEADAGRYAAAAARLDPAAIQRQKQLNEPTYTTAEVLAHLKSLE